MSEKHPKENITKILFVFRDIAWLIIIKSLCIHIFYCYQLGNYTDIAHNRINHSYLPLIKHCTLRNVQYCNRTYDKAQCFSHIYGHDREGRYYIHYNAHIRTYLISKNRFQNTCIPARILIKCIRVYPPVKRPQVVHIKHSTVLKRLKYGPFQISKMGHYLL